MTGRVHLELQFESIKMYLSTYYSIMEVVCTYVHIIISGLRSLDLKDKYFCDHIGHWEDNHCISFDMNLLEFRCLRSF